MCGETRKIFNATALIPWDWKGSGQFGKLRKKIIGGVPGEPVIMQGSQHCRRGYVIMSPTALCLSLSPKRQRPSQDCGWERDPWQADGGKEYDVAV